MPRRRASQDEADVFVMSRQGQGGYHRALAFGGFVLVCLCRGGGSTAVSCSLPPILGLGRTRLILPPTLIPTSRLGVPATSRRWRFSRRRSERAGLPSPRRRATAARGQKLGFRSRTGKREEQVGDGGGGRRQHRQQQRASGEAAKSSRSLPRFFARRFEVALSVDGVDGRCDDGDAIRRLQLRLTGVG